MGNLSFQCFADETEERNYKEIKQIQQKEDQSQNISVQNIKNQQLINLFQQHQNEISEINIAIQDCSFCQQHFKELRRSDNLKYIQYPNSQWQKNAIHSCKIKQLNESNQFSEPLPILQNDPISEYTSEWFQLFLSQRKFIRLKEHFEGLPEQQKQFNFLNCQLDDHDLYSLICLKWCVVDFFKKKHSLFPKNNFLENFCIVFNNVAHICQFYNELFLENQKKNDYVHNIKLYIKLYQQYQQLMNTFQNQYDLQCDLIQQMYEKKFNLQAESTQSKFYPHFKLIGYMIRFWCQITLTTEVIDILRESYKNLVIQNNKELIQIYFITALDVDINEYYVHWIGHRKKFEIQKTLLNFNILEQIVTKVECEQITNSEFYQQIDEKIEELRPLYPQWFFEVEFECLGIEYKIARLMSDVKSQNQYEISKLKKSQGLEIFDTASTLNTENEVELMAIYLQESNLIPNSKFRQSCSNKSTYISCSSEQKPNMDSTWCSLKVSQEALQISKEIGNEYKQKLAEFNQRLSRVQENISSRERKLEQRALELKFPIEDKVEWLNFFQKTDFSKIPASGKEIQKYQDRILQELKSQDSGNQFQLLQSK